MAFAPHARGITTYESSHYHSERTEDQISSRLGESDLAISSHVGLSACLVCDRCTDALDCRMEARLQLEISFPSWVELSTRSEASTGCLSIK
jgi:hypothetical protein